MAETQFRSFNSHARCTIRVKHRPEGPNPVEIRVKNTNCIHRIPISRSHNVGLD